MLRRTIDLVRAGVPSRGALGVFLLGLSLGTLASSPLLSASAEPRTLAALLATASETLVDWDEVRAEGGGPGGAVSDLFFGRQVLFLGRTEHGAPRDVYRATVRVWPDGKLVAISSIHNLTATPIGDDHELVVHGTHAAFATAAYGREQSVTLLRLDGEGADNKAERFTDRVQAWITNLQQTGSGAGVGRVEVPFERPLRAVGLALSSDTLRVDLADGATASESAEIDVRTGEPLPGSMLHTEPKVHLPKRLSHWLVDTLRAVSWIGPKPITWLEETSFAAKDSIKRFVFRVHGDNQLVDTKREEPAASRVAPPEGPFVDTVVWPPPPVPSIWQHAERGEGEWVSAAKPWTKHPATADSSAPPPFYRTFVRPDTERPYSKVILVAMDTRQLELDMEAGTEDPEPLTGPHGTGRIPRDPAVYTRIVAAFNGAFKTEHGHYGMMVHGRVLLPAVPGAATVIVTKDHRTGMGTWGANASTPEISGLPDDAVVSFRQNLDPLVDRGQVNPAGRNLWGYTLPGTGMQTERTGLCVTSSGHLIYAWGDDANGTTIAKAQKMAGCDYGMHLDMNPYHTGFIFTNIEDLPAHRYKSELLTPAMQIPTDRYIQYAPKDFFYIMVRGALPPAVLGATAWQVDGGKQPPPSWLGALFGARAHVHGVDIELTDIEPSRVVFRVRAGAKELPAAQLARELSREDAKEVALAVAMGHSSEKRPLGLTTAGRRGAVDFAGEGLGTVLLGGDGQVTITKGALAFEIAADADSVELPLLTFDGETFESRAPVEGPRAALGTSPEGRVVLARGTTTPTVLGDALTLAGCTRAVLLDRGMRASATYFRAGKGDVSMPSTEETVLYALAKSMKPRGFRFEAKTAAPASASR